MAHVFVFYLLNKYQKTYHNDVKSQQYDPSERGGGILACYPVQFVSFMTDISFLSNV